ncbi:hypothetical protein, conserved [Trypanosoma brucei brucei TREU927]|uniref:Uncharacterized protein n=1 Tax=Trypanosoma brucei brucei (strain 927/4 GUTat10.1) TaxID=185431 RepID=Q384P7_TRYB2|nr:hypothetical protein, conserved [Trypanosoma brucei brucei TREU927]EAN79734.1 hypothetical protein, conserved [Trypanosoma brucei brucei TREU927]
MWHSFLRLNPLSPLLMRCHHRHHRTALAGFSGCGIASSALQNPLRACMCTLSQHSGETTDSCGDVHSSAVGATVSSKSVRMTCDLHGTSSTQTQVEEMSGESMDLKRMLFSLKDHNTGVVTCLDVEERLRNVELLDEWCVRKLFRDSGWVSKVQEEGETAPQYRNIIGEHRILRNMLERFVSNRAMWHDELIELLQLVLKRGAEVQESKDLLDVGFRNGEKHPVTHHNFTPNRVHSRCSRAVVECCHNGVVAFDAAMIWNSLRRISDSSCFYSYGLQGVLWEFLHYGSNSSGDPRELWHMFVAFYRNMRVAPSTKRPLFSSHDMIITLTETEFQEDTRESVMAGVMGENELTENVVDGVSLNWPEGWKAKDPTHLSEEGFPADCKRRTNCNARHQRYLTDTFYINMIEPSEVLTGCHNSCGSEISTEELEQEKGRAATGGWWRGEERNVINPMNGELEDIHLTQLWHLFQNMRIDEIVDVYRTVCGGFGALQAEVYVDIMTRRALLMLFFARDEVRAITPPPVTYQRLSSLHNELLCLSSWCLASPQRNSFLVAPPRPFEELPLQDQLSYSCFGQLHAPRMPRRFCLPKSAATPEELYRWYCEMYPLFSSSCDSRVAAEVLDSNQKDSCNSSAVGTSCTWPRFEWLNELQQSSLRFPFGDSVYFQSTSYSTPDTTEPLAMTGTRPSTSNEATGDASGARTESSREAHKRRTRHRKNRGSSTPHKEVRRITSDGESSHKSAEFAAGDTPSEEPAVLKNVSRQREHFKGAKKTSKTKEKHHHRRSSDKLRTEDVQRSADEGKPEEPRLTGGEPMRRARPRGSKKKQSAKGKHHRGSVDGISKRQSVTTNEVSKRKKGPKGTKSTPKTYEEVWYPTPDSKASGEGTQLIPDAETNEEVESTKKVAIRRTHPKREKKDSHNVLKGRRYATAESESSREKIRSDTNDEANGDVAPVDTEPKRRGRPKKSGGIVGAQVEV